MEELDKEKLGQTITPKQKRDSISAFYPTIKKFIKQADKANNLKVNSYIKEYNGLKVDISFGKGDYDHIPRITFLYEGQTTSNGIYPGFLYYKEQKTLILAYIVSETVKPTLNWNLPENVQTIKSYFFSNGLGIPERYGNSYVYRVYSPTSEIESSSLDQDLQKITSVYKRIMSHSAETLIIEDQANEPFNIHRIAEIRNTGLLFGKDLLYRYIVSLLTKPFVILSGLSGSGKTRLALTFAKWLSNNKSQIKIISVGSDWNNREYLLGYPNALDCGKYIKPENGVLDFILEAIQNPTKPYFLILDEMNLSYVERYFADFLSTMESHEAITLHPGTDDWNNCDVPAEIRLPENLYITGTINVDETTYMFSPKVLDRANVIEFRISEAEMEEYLKLCKPLEPDAIDHKGATMGSDFIQISKDKSFKNNEVFNKILISFFTQLKQAGAEFGYRTVAEIYRFISLSGKLNAGWDNDKLMDIVVMQKMLPKLHGSRKKMQPILTAIWKLCQKTENDTILIENEDIRIDERFRYPLSATKIRQMYKNARDNGFTSYAEA